MKLYGSNIDSSIEALKMKDSEQIFINTFENQLKGNAICRIVPTSGVFLDWMYEEDNKILFVKFLDTNEDTFSILGEEIIEVLDEEKKKLEEYVEKIGLNLSYNMIFFMPNVKLSKEDKREYIVDSAKFKSLKSNPEKIREFLLAGNSDIEPNLIRYYMAKENHIIKRAPYEDESLFKKITFQGKTTQTQFCAISLDEAQLNIANEIKHGATIIEGAAGTGKTTILLARALKLAKLYPKDKFLVVTFNKQLANEIKAFLNVTELNLKNLEVVNFHSFIIRLAKGLHMGLEQIIKKEDFNDTFKKMFKKLKILISEKHIYKGIFIDEGEAFEFEEFEFFKDLLYKTKNIYTVTMDKAKEMKSKNEIFCCEAEKLNYDYHLHLECNYRHSQAVGGIINRFGNKLKLYCKDHNIELPKGYYQESSLNRKIEGKWKFITVGSLEEKINRIIKSIEEMHESGIDYRDICIIYPYSKRRIKNGNTIYFQYILKKALEEAKIPHNYGNEELTSLTGRIGVTISTIYSVKNLEFKAVVFCEIEMLFSHGLNSSEKLGAYEIKSFIKNANIIYSSITRASEILYIISTFNEENSELIGFLQ